jgi:hypothetical protein
MVSSSDVTGKLLHLNGLSFRTYTRLASGARAREPQSERLNPTRIFTTRAAMGRLVPGANVRVRRSQL